MAEASIAPADGRRLGPREGMSIYEARDDPRLPGLIVTDIYQRGAGTIRLTAAATSALVAAVHACRKSMTHQLYAEGWNKRQIGLALNVGRRTIQLWLKEEKS